jgi:hypothetical protein
MFLFPTLYVPTSAPWLHDRSARTLGLSLLCIRTAFGANPKVIYSRPQTLFVLLFANQLKVRSRKKAPQHVQAGVQEISLNQAQFPEILMGAKAVAKSFGEIQESLSEVIPNKNSPNHTICFKFQV